MELTAIIICLALSSVFSATETAFTSLSIFQVEKLVQKKGRKGELVKDLSGRPEILLSTVLIMNNLVNISASALTANYTIKLFGSGALGISTGLLTLIILIFGEVTPKRLAIIHNEFICLLMARFILLLSIILKPVILFINSVSFLLNRIFSSKRAAALSLEGLLQMVNVAEQMGIVKNYETQMVKRIFSVNETLVQAILTHRTEVFSMEMHTSLKSALEKLIKSGFSRIPVYDKDPEIIVGIILLKDILRELAAGNENKRLKDIMQKPIFVSSTKKVSHMLRLFKKEKLNMAIVLDEYGGLAGIVTTEDVVEEITGELYDEHEEKESDKIVPMGPATYRIQADTPLNQLTELIGSEARHGRFSQTLAGYITEHSGKLLQEGELLRIDNCEYYIEQTDKNRIVSVIFRKIKKH